MSRVVTDMKFKLRKSKDTREGNRFELEGLNQELKKENNQEDHELALCLTIQQGLTSDLNSILDELAVLKAQETEARRKLNATGYWLKQWDELQTVFPKLLSASTFIDRLGYTRLDLGNTTLEALLRIKVEENQLTASQIAEEIIFNYQEMRRQYNQMMTDYVELKNNVP